MLTGFSPLCFLSCFFPPLGTSNLLPADFEEKLWEKLQLAIRAVHAKESVKYGEEELYKVRYNYRVLLLLTWGFRLQKISVSTNWEEICTKGFKMSVKFILRVSSLRCYNILFLLTCFFFFPPPFLPLHEY